MVMIFDHWFVHGLDMHCGMWNIQKYLNFTHFWGVLASKRRFFHRNQGLKWNLPLSFNPARALGPIQGPFCPPPLLRGSSGLEHRVSDNKTLNFMRQSGTLCTGPPHQMYVCMNPNKNDCNSNTCTTIKMPGNENCNSMSGSEINDFKLN